MKTVMPATGRGPLAGAVMEQLSAWLATERYARSMVPQILGVTRGLSAWMDDHDIALQALTVGVLDSFEAAYGRTVPGHTLVATRMPPLRRFLTETGYLPGVELARRQVRRPVNKPAPPISTAA